MKKLLMTVAIITLAGGAAVAGPNGGGIIFVHNAGIGMNGNMCGQGVAPASCEDANTELDSQDPTPQVWKVYAAFKPCTAPRLKAMAFGITYSDYNHGGTLVLLGHGACIGDTHNGAAEFPNSGWPASGGGDVIVWQYTQTSLLVEAYWFAGYSYPYGSPSTFALGANPDPGLGGVFADDSVPALMDPIAAYGTLGFNQPGSVPCPTAGAEGACCVDTQCTMTCEGDCSGWWAGQNSVCDPNPCSIPRGACCLNGECYVLPQSECIEDGGLYNGDDTTCPYVGCTDPPPFPVHESTWGAIKARYH